MDRQTDLTRGNIKKQLALFRRKEEKQAART